MERGEEGEIENAHALVRESLSSYLCVSVSAPVCAFVCARERGSERDLAWVARHLSVN